MDRALVSPRVPRGTPPGALPDRYVRPLLALIEVHHRDGRATVRTVGDELGLSPQIVHKWLHRLAAFGLVEIGVAGGLRPLVSAHQPITNQEATA